MDKFIDRAFEELWNYVKTLATAVFVLGIGMALSSISYSDR